MNQTLFAKKKDIIHAYLQILFGSVIGAAAYPTFLVPNNIAPGGLTGVATILNYLWNWPVGTVSLILNVPLFIIGYRTMGRIFAFRSLIATALFSVLIDILPLKAVSADPVLDPLLGTLFGGVLLGIGLGLILRGGATTGGSDMIARMVHRRFNFITVGMFLFAIDMMVVLAAGIFIGGAQALFAMINIYVCSRVIDVLQEQGLTEATCGDLEKHAYSVNDKILDSGVRNMHIMTAVS